MSPFGRAVAARIIFLRGEEEPIGGCAGVASGCGDCGGEGEGAPEDDDVDDDDDLSGLGVGDASVDDTE